MPQLIKIQYANVTTSRERQQELLRLSMAFRNYLRIPQNYASLDEHLNSPSADKN